MLALLALATRLRMRARAAGAARRWPAEGQFVTVEGIRIHVTVVPPDRLTGRGDQPPRELRDLVLIHGASGSGRDFTFALAQALAGRYRLFIPDRPGFGWSGAAPGHESLAGQARLLREACTALGARDPMVLGHSYGGAVALAWAVGAPDSLSALLPLSAASHPWTGGVGLLYRICGSRWGQKLVVPLIAAWVPRGMVTSAVAEVFAPQQVPPGYPGHFGAEMSVRAESFAVNARQRLPLSDELAAMSRRYPALTLPVEVLHGTADPVVPIGLHAVALAAAIPGAAFTALAGVGHMPHHVAPGAVIAAIDRLAERSGTASRVAVDPIPRDTGAGSGD